MSRTPQLVILFALISCFFGIDAGAQTDSVREVVRQLHLAAGETDGRSSPDVPPAVEKLLPLLKDGVRDTITRSLNSHASSSAEALRDLLLADLKQAGVEVIDDSQPADQYDPNTEKYGYLYGVDVRQPARHPNLLGVVATFTIPCGGDTSLTLYEHQGATWKPILISERNGYGKICEAQGSMQYAISPPDAAGDWFLVVADVNPSCSSNWQGLRYKVLRPGDKTDHPRQLLDEHRGIFLGGEQPFRLTINAAGFQIQQLDSQSLDAGILTRLHVQKYSVAGDTVTRVAPVAFDPEDFLDEWFDMKWEDASHWISGSDASEFSRWHSRFHAHESERDFSTEFDFVEPCPSGATDPRWQIGVTLEGTGEKDLPRDLPDELFFTVRKHEDSFLLEGLSTERPPGCPGEAKPSAHSLSGATSPKE